MRGFAVALRPYGSGTRGIGPPCQMRCRARRVQCGECPPCPIRVRWLDGSRQAAMRLLAPAVSRRERGSDGNARARPAERAWRPTPQWAYRSRRPKRHRECQPGDQPVWPLRHTTQVSTTQESAPHGARTTTNARMGEALFGRQELVADAPLHRFRRRSRTHPWAKPCLAGDDLQPACRSARSESDCEPTHGRSPVWRADPRRSYERNFPRRTLRVAARLGWSFLITP
jgi:hypothetical protein